MIDDMADCLICGSKGKLKEGELPGYMEPEKFQIWNCSECDASFSLPRVENTEKIYDLIYRNIDRIPNYNRYLFYADSVLKEEDPLGFLCRHEQSYYGIKKALFDSLKANRDTSILEIGCGLGYLTYALNKAGLNVRGTDISVKAITDAENRFGPFYSSKSVDELANEYGGKYDIIIMTELLEHVSDIMKFLEQVARLLKSDGKIIVTTPDKAPFSKISSWCTDLPPVHCWWLSEKSVQKIGSVLGFKTRFVNFRGFYSKNPAIIKLSSVVPEKPTFNSAGDILRNENEGALTRVKPGKKPGLKQITGERIYNLARKIYYSVRPGYTVFSRRGFSICAILYR
jgi:2-polyprenyl-3-methyl-5-hydroxy-6-metoxy-1,4-benzoquinol methylase